MSAVENILAKYEILEAQVLYAKAQELLELITDEEYEQILQKYNKLFSKLSCVSNGREIILSKDAMREAIRIFVRTIKERRLSKDEFDIMTIDDIKEYICKIVKDKSNPALFDVIRTLEV